MSDKPTIPDAQIQSDWNQSTTTAKDYIKNKPTIPDVTGKADKVQSATSGHLAGLNASGNLTDSGIVPSILVYQGASQGTVPSVDFDPETDTVHVTAQTLSAAQQAQVRTNIGAGTSDFSGSYNDLTNKPTIPDAQIQSDWNQTITTAKDYIKNKPTIPDTSNFVQKSQTSGLLKNDGTVDTNTYLTTAPVTSVNGQTGAVSLTIPTVPTNVGAFTNDAGYLTSHQDISGKADKVVVVNASTLPSSLDPNKVYQMGTLAGSVTIPAFSAVTSGDTEVKIWCFTFETGTTSPTIIWPAAITNWVGGSAPTINASKSYEVTVMDGIGAIMEA